MAHLLRYDVPFSWVLDSRLGMPSQLHDAVLDLFRDNLQLAPGLLQERFGLPLHPGQVRVLDSALSKNNAATLYPDLVLLVELDGQETVLAIEVQLRIDDSKRAVWLCYLALLAQTLDRDVVVLVVTLTGAVERWASKARSFGHPGHQFAPLVLGPSSLPVVADLADPARLLLSALTHTRQEIDEERARLLLDACQSLDDARGRMYLDLVLSTLDPASRATLEKLMIQNYVYQSDFAKRYIAIGREEGREEGIEKGIERGRLAGQAELLLSLLSSRGLTADLATRQRILACTDSGLLLRWVTRAATATSLEQVFTD